MTGDLYGDYSRLTFAPEKHYSSVLVQQGRVTLDADANEQAAITRHWLRRLTLDLVGRRGTPADPDANFEITISGDVVRIAGGHMYVEGLLVECEKGTTYYEQPHGHLQDNRPEDRLPALGKPYVIFLRAWERHITAIEDPAIRETALGVNGPDTAARTKIVWQVKVAAEFPPGSGSKVEDWTREAALGKWADWEQQQAALKRPRLKARAQAPEDTVAPCIAPADAAYRGLENQLYRVEVHNDGDDDVTWKWSRDNGAVTFAVDSLDGADVTLSSLGRDHALGLDVGDMVELADDRSVMRGTRTTLLEVVAIDELERRVTLDPAPDGDVGHNPALRPLLRRWDHGSHADAFDSARGVLRVDEGGWAELENGVQIQFQDSGKYRAGDYWLIPARTAIANVEWPAAASGSPEARPPVGIDYGYAPLAVVHADGTVVDLRTLFTPNVP
jgi:hypothetical protein